VQNGAPVTQVLLVRGEGAASGVVTQQLQIDGRVPTLNLLLVVDDSSTMADEQAALSAVLAQSGTTSRFDLSVGVVDTSGREHPNSAGSLWTPSHFPNAAMEWSRLVQVGLTGTVESCLEPASRVVRGMPPGQKAVVLCVTDSGEQGPHSIAPYLNAMSVDRPAVSYNVVGPFLPTAPTGCTYDDPDDGRHAAAVSATGGLQAEVCGAAWGPLLEAVIARHLDYQTVFPLEGAADLAQAIEVQLDGQVIPPQVGSDSVWTYDAARTAIVFAPRFAPEPGKTLTIRYTAVCL
jgi:hypothetical protein